LSVSFAGAHDQCGGNFLDRDSDAVTEANIPIPPFRRANGLAHHRTAVPSDHMVTTRVPQFLTFPL
jgi:hypothetical protein